MNPARKRTVRLVVALSVAVVLASALIYTSFSAASPALSPSQLVHQAQPGRSYLLTGTVLAHSVVRNGAVLDFSVADRAGSTTTAVPVAYTGTVPDPHCRSSPHGVHEMGGTTPVGVVVVGALGADGAGGARWGGRCGHAADAYAAAGGPAGGTAPGGCRLR